MSRAEVGVLALQGDVAPHCAALARVGAQARRVRRAADLDGLSHLVVPGGESTAQQLLMERFGLWAALAERHRSGALALFGTCAGAVLLGRSEDGARPPRMGLIDAAVERNAFGRQVHSSVCEQRLEGLDVDFRCVFIRAPRIAAVGPAVRVLARAGGDPILVSTDDVLLATFHPELAGDDRLHAHFLAHVGGAA